MTDELQQRVEWKTRLVTDLIKRRFDDATLEAMLDAGLAQAHSEGLQDAAEVCAGVAEALPTAPLTRRAALTRHAALVLARSIRALDRLNRGGDHRKAV